MINDWEVRIINESNPQLHSKESTALNEQ